MESVRLRLVFQRRDILSKSQKLDRLNRSWLLLKPELGTISDLSSYLIDVFDLNHSCPNGLLFYMDGFVLPPFESTAILQDKDIIRVKKKGGLLSDIIKADNEAKSIEEEKIVEKQPVLSSSPLLLANEEFEKETAGCQSETEEEEDDQSKDTLQVLQSLTKKASKKRKASNKLRSSKRKKKCLMVPEVVDHTEETESCHEDRVISGKSLHKKKVSQEISMPDGASSPEITGTSNEIGDATPTAERSVQVQRDKTGSVDILHKHDGNRKVPSRSARRKKAKRQWLKELKAQGKEISQKKSAEKSIVKSPPGEKGLRTLFPNQNNDVEDDIVPIVIRPGHIRFEPLQEDSTAQQKQVPVETFLWNGITSKRKGQKWGTEKFSSCRRNDSEYLNEECSKIRTVEKKMAVNDPIDFDMLPPLAGLPKEGDVIAYRLLELSSSWTPELSSFRVGKTLSFDSESNMIVLRPVPEHPIVFKKLVDRDGDEDASPQTADDFPYREDGSLEIDFSSLVDVRVVEHVSSDIVKAASGNVDEGPICNKDVQSAVLSKINQNETNAPASGKEENVWDEISQALSAKKAMLSREKDWSEKNSGRGPWSYRSLRGSALGPTMALLRSQNDI